jgi:adenylate kinase family enzyme
MTHDRIIKSEEWIVDGYGCLETLWSRFEVADTLIYIDLPLLIHFFWVSKRLVQGLFTNPEGWPENSPVIKSSLTSYRVLIACHRLLTPKYREYVTRIKETKDVYHLKSISDISIFLTEISNQNA